MKKSLFSKSFTQQEQIPEEGIINAIDLMRSGKLHRYNVAKDELSQASVLEKEYADWQGCKYCIACTSGGFAIQLALRSLGIGEGTEVLANAYTLAPVPGAIQNVGATPIFVEIDQNYHIDLNDLNNKAKNSGAKFLLLSHMRGHIVNMDNLMEICSQNNIKLIEDCAHTMGAKWQNKKSGNHGVVSAFSSQTYKHINSGEGGFLTTDDDLLAAKAIILSGSYMLYERHGSIPKKEVFEKVKFNTPNHSGRMDNLRATILRSQISLIDKNVVRWNKLYDVIYKRLLSHKSVEIPSRSSKEYFVGSSIQFRININVAYIPNFLSSCLQRGVELKWFGDKNPVGFTSRFDSWRYFSHIQSLPKTIKTLSNTIDMRIPLTFNESDCNTIVDIIEDELDKFEN